VLETLLVTSYEDVCLAYNMRTFVLHTPLNFPFGKLSSIAGRRGDYEAPANEATRNHLGKRSNACSSFDLPNDISPLAL
jgi:hypothetical protein